MYALAKSAREKMKAKARMLASEKDQKVDSSDWTPPPFLRAEVKTGARPIMKPSAKGTGESYAARDTKKAIGADMKRGGFKAGGAVKKSGVSIPTPKETLSTKEIVGANPIRPTRGKAENYKKGGAVKKAGGGSMLEKMVGKPKGSDYSQVGKMGTANYTQEDKGALNRALKGDDALPEPAEAAERSGKYQNYKSGGKAKWIQSAIGKPGALRKSLGVKKGEKIPEKKLEAAAEKGGKLGRRARLAQTLKGLHKSHGGEAEDRAERKAGGRTRAKGKTNINIVIAAGRKAGPEAPALDMAGGMPSAPANIPVPMPGPGAPPPAAMPMGGPPGMPAPGLLPGRKAGGRITKVASSYKDMQAGSGSGEGRLQKTDIAKKHHDAPARKRGGKVYSSYKDMDAGAGSGPGRLEKTEIEKKQRARGK